MLFANWTSFKTLADPYFAKSGKVDLLIGKYSNRCRRHMRIEDAPDRDLMVLRLYSVGSLEEIPR